MCETEKLAEGDTAGSMHTASDTVVNEMLGVDDATSDTAEIPETNRYYG